MATYIINQANSIFSGPRGQTFHTEPGPFVDAAVRSGIITRVDAAETRNKEPKRETEKVEKAGNKADSKKKADV